ncbi:MAG TPA: type II toxin-antitoxin system VapC family toxin [Anaerolineales bacterium]|nr:type II toxin-antitoxin system VapC family toxin [Anaerolineales bacterium]
MNYLLDTHTFLWAIADSGKLPKPAREIIVSPENEIYISAVTFWEIGIKSRLGKLDLGNLAPEQLVSIAEEMEFQTISLTAEEASTYSRLKETHHKDPFDRMLVWQAIQRNFVIISKDRKFAKFEPFGLKISWD